MNDNNFNDEIFDPDVQENKEPESGENITADDIPEKVQRETVEDIFSNKNNEENIREAVFENAEEAQAQYTPTAYQEYPRPDIPEMPLQREETLPEPEPVESVQSEENTFNPYAPRNNTDSPVQHVGHVNPGYSNLNQPYPYQQNQPSYQQNQPPYRQNQPYGSQYQPADNYGASPSPEEPKKSKGKTVIGIILAVCLGLAVIGMVVGLLSGNEPDVQNTTTAPGQTTQFRDVTEQNESTTGNIEVSTTQPVTDVANSVMVADKVRPSVVGVMTYIEGKLSGEGSGVLMSEKDGWTYIVTCAHVINERGVSYSVLLLDGRSLEAQLVAYDDRTDIGVVKVNETGLPLAEFGDSTTLRIGEPVYAIGNPGGSEYFGSITNGIVSAIDRSVTSTYTMTCIQHNAAINPGNSGGALVNSAGQVIGINSSKIASTEFEGMGFAVPTSIASPVVDALVQFGYVPNRPKLGIEYAPVSSYQLYGLVVSIKGLPQGSLVIAGISEDSSLANTEAQVGDLIIAVNGKDMDDSSVLLDFIETGSVGDTLTLTLCRIENRTYRTSTFDVTITLVEDKGVNKQETTEPATEYQDDGFYRGGTDSFEDFFNEYFGW